MFSYNKKSGLLFSTCDWRSQSDVCCLAVTTNSLSHACRLCRREDDSLNFCPHRSDCVHAAAGWQSPWDFPGHPNYCQLCHVHHDPDHLLCHPERGRPQSAPPYAQHTHHAQLGPNGETRLVLIYLASVCALLVLGTIWMLTFSEKKMPRLSSISCLSTLAWWGRSPRRRWRGKNPMRTRLYIALMEGNLEESISSVKSTQIWSHPGETGMYTGVDTTQGGLFCISICLFTSGSYTGGSQLRS